MSTTLRIRTSVSDIKALSIKHIRNELPNQQDYQEVSRAFTQLEIALDKINLKYPDSQFQKTNNDVCFHASGNILDFCEKNLKERG